MDISKKEIDRLIQSNDLDDHETLAKKALKGLIDYAPYCSEENLKSLRSLVIDMAQMWLDDTGHKSPGWFNDISEEYGRLFDMAKERTGRLRPISDRRRQCIVAGLERHILNVVGSDRKLTYEIPILMELRKEWYQAIKLIDDTPGIADILKKEGIAGYV